MNKMVSLIVPCYNGEKYLQRCFNCILKQTYHTVQLIFVNDGSQDGTKEIVDYYTHFWKEKKYLFEYIYQKNLGAAAAVNTALQYVKGDYIMLYDVDDILFPTAIEKKVSFLETYPEYGMVRNNGYFVLDENTNRPLSKFVTNEKEKRNEYIFQDLLYIKTNNWAGSYMVRTEALFKYLENRKIYVSEFGQNLQIMLPVACFYKCGFIDEELMSVVIVNNSHSHSQNKERQWQLVNGYQENRIEIVKRLPISENEKQNYIFNIEVVYLKTKLRIANENFDKILARKFFFELIARKKADFKDILIFFQSEWKLMDKIIKLVCKK